MTTGESAALAFARAVTACDRDAAVAASHPEIEFTSVLGIAGTAYHGHAGIRRYLDDVESAWDEWRVAVHRVEEQADGRVLIEMTMHARGQGSGVTITERDLHLWTLRDELLLRNEPHREHR